MNQQTIILDGNDVALVKAHIDAAAEEIARVYDKLPDTAQAEALRLAHALSKLRKTISKT